MTSDHYNETFADKLEAIVDRSNLWLVVESLECICQEKAAHIRENWQDEGLAKQWDKAAKELNRTVSRLQKLSGTY